MQLFKHKYFANLIHPTGTYNYDNTYPKEAEPYTCIDNNELWLHSSYYNLEKGIIKPLLLSEWSSDNSGNYSITYNYQNVHLDTFPLGVRFVHKGNKIFYNNVDFTFGGVTAHQFNELYDYSDVYACPSFKRLQSVSEHKDGREVITSYKYGEDYKTIPLSVTKQVKNGIDTIVSTTKYTFQSDDTVSKDMSKRYALLPIQKESSKNGVTFSCDKIEYKKMNNGYVPFQYIHGINEDNLKEQTKIEYNSNNKIATLTHNNGECTSFIWNNDNQNIAAKIEGLSGQEVREIASACGISQNVFNGNISIRNLEKLRRALSLNKKPNLMTTYDYTPLIGMNFQISPNEIKTSYKYDVMGRLQTVFDNNDDKTDYYFYKYNGELKGFDSNPINNYTAHFKCLDENAKEFYADIQHYNGFGYPNIHASNNGNDGGMCYSYIEYDGAMREKSKSLLIPDDDKHDVVTIQELKDLSSEFYNDKYAFTENSYDVLDRVTSTATAGEEWHKASKNKSISYGTNDDMSKVWRFRAPLENESNYKLNKQYPVGVLSEEKQTDEDGHFIEVYTDLMGNKVLERRNDKNNTYYIYNNLGQLRFVQTPLCLKNNHCYEYRYDNRGRVIKKMLPQHEYIQYWYDDCNQVIFTQDYKLRAQNRYRFMLYDNLGRLAIQGTCKAHNLELTSRIVATYKSNISGICNTGYDLSIPNLITDVKLEIVNYYDKYDFINGNLKEKFKFASYSQQNVIGQNTGSIVSTSDGNMIYTVRHYNDKGLLANLERTTLNNDIEKMSYVYTFTNQPQETTHDLFHNGRNMVSIKTSNEYNIRNAQLNNVTLSASVKGAQTISKDIATYHYDKIGRLTELGRGGNAGSVRYKYNLHGWTTNIESRDFNEVLFYTNGIGTPYYSGNISVQLWRDASYRVNDEMQYRGYKFSYDQLNRLTNAVYGEGSDLTSNRELYNERVAEYDANGNIIRFQRNGRKRNGKYGLIDDLTIKTNGNQISYVYDNAETLLYEGAIDVPMGTLNHCRYNENGALISDENRGIANIDYDDNDNPIRIQFTNGNVTRYVYSSEGEKLRTIHFTTMPNIKVAIGGTHILQPAEILFKDSTDYIDNLIIENGKLSKCLFEGGYCTFEKDSVPTFHYFTKDHLGNNRVVVNEDGTIEQVTNYYPFGTPYFDSTSTNASIQRYKYNGKELDLTHGLNTYDYGARQYNPVVPTWDRIDQLAEKYYNISPYVYCANNPLNAIDLDGMDYWSTSDNEQIADFINAIGRGDYQFDFSDWNHITNEDFCAKLVYNDETNKYYTSYAEVINGEVVVTGKSFDANLMPVSNIGAGYLGAYVYEPVNGFLENLNYFLNGLTYYDGFTNWSVNKAGRITDIAPTEGIVDWGGKSKLSYLRSVLPKGFKLVRGLYSHSEKVYQYNGKYYSLDNTSHNGGIWKVFEMRGDKLIRIGTADKNLNIFKK